MENKITSFVSFRVFQDNKNHTLSFRAFLNKLFDGNSFGITNITKLYPGLREKFDRSKNVPNTPNKTKSDTIKSQDQSDALDDITKKPEYSDNKILLKGYNVIERCIDPNDDMYKLRLDGHFGYQNSCLPITEDANKRQKMTCILCCAKCESKDSF